MAVYLRLSTQQSLVLRTLGSHGSTLTTSHCKQKLLCSGLRTALVYASCASITAMGTSCLESGIAVCKVQIWENNICHLYTRQEVSRDVEIKYQNI